ncbi:endospore germination permease [Paenibacillus thermoaerophilus]|uniref:Endospore germination permease n=1 Tax=Paenibacillus thermoaerophilus TaxID=1215385 RepID=A0ABW2V4E1_9BACL|nr:endospore germination permease [Paenibacillus thermoaerophilus]TMV18858.1 spore gernimation protein [Paenibacillus thermoaerophilus]
MIEKARISPSQLGMMMYLATTPTAILSTPAITYIFAKEDLWISPFWAFSGVIAVYVALQLHRMYPGLNLVQASERIVGRFLGKIIGFMFPLYYLYLNGIVVREYGEFVVGAFLLNTPLIVVTGSMVLICAIAVRGGVEILGRFSELFLPAFLALFLFILVPIIPDLKLSNMLPIMGEGIRPSIEGSFVLQTWFAELITVSYFLPYVADQGKAKISIWITFLMVVLTLVVSNLATLLLLGDITGSFTYPFLILARYIDLAEFFTHLESLYMAIWVLGAFVKICVFHYVTALGAAQWMRLSDYRPLVLPLGLLLVLFSIWVAPNYQELTHAISTSVTLSIMTVFVILPALLFCMAVVRNRLAGKAARR